MTHEERLVRFMCAATTGLLAEPENGFNQTILEAMAERAGFSDDLPPEQRIAECARQIAFALNYQLETCLGQENRPLDPR